MTNKTLSVAEKKIVRENLKALIIEKIDVDGMVDIGRGSSEFLEISHTLMVSAVMDIQAKYRTFYVPIVREDDPTRELTIKVIAPSYLDYRAILRRKDLIQNFTEAERDRIHNR